MSSGISSGSCGYQPLSGGFNDLVGVAVGDGYIFASDPGNEGEDIQVFDLNGNYVTFFWPYTSYNEIDRYPWGMKVANNRLYVANSGCGVIDVYNIPDIIAQAAQTQNCNDVLAYASYWNGNGYEPYDVDVDSVGNMYVADPSANFGEQVYVISPRFSNVSPNEGNYVLVATSYGSPSIDGGYLDDPYGITVDPTGHHVYVADSYNNVIQVYDGSLNSVGFIGNSAGVTSALAGQFDFPIGVRMDNQGNLIVTDTDNARVQRLTTSGSVLNIIGTSTGNGELYSPIYSAVDSNNNLYVTDDNLSTIMVYSGK
jgi:DNA-binding beta-propeller fold protein YncE